MDWSENNYNEDFVFFVKAFRINSVIITICFSQVVKESQVHICDMIAMQWFFKYAQKLLHSQKKI